MRKDFYIFRHGQTDYNLEKRWQGSSIDSELNATGMEQAQALVPVLQDCGLEIIFTSGLKRAHKTAEIVAENLGLEVIVINNLREGCFGDAEGMIKSDIAQVYPDVFEQWYSLEDDMDVRFPNGESKYEMSERMLGVLSELLESDYNTIGIASHGSSIRYLLMGLGYKLKTMPNTALFHVVYEDGNWQVIGQV